MLTKIPPVALAPAAAVLGDMSSSGLLNIYALMDPLVEQNQGFKTTIQVGLQLINGDRELRLLLIGSKGPAHWWSRARHSTPPSRRSAGLGGLVSGPLADGVSLPVG